MPGELKESQVRQTAILLGLSPDFIRKDYFITKAIRLLVGIKNDYFKLVFQGGTSLSKGYGVINRLSEDIDFRMVTTSLGLNLGKDAKRRELRNFRHNLIKTLRAEEFDITVDDVRVYYEGRYMSIRASFNGSNTILYLKPHIAIDCFLGTLELQPEVNQISSMIKVTLGNDYCDHQYFPVECVALDETAAEKWVALSRRVVDAKQTPRDSDKHLVRHLYDLHQLHSQQRISTHYDSVLEKVIKKEEAMFGTASKLLHTNASTALTYFQTDKQWEDHWNYFLEQMVYEKNKATFSEAIQSIAELNIKQLQSFIRIDKAQNAVEKPVLNSQSVKRKGIKY